MSYPVGAILGDYEIVGVIGAGGMGEVYKVRNTISDRIEAMKILLPNLDADQELAERFLREIKVQASLQHPNIASLRTAQRFNNQLLMIMEFVDGDTIEKIMREKHVALPDCINYASQVLSALAYAHAHGVVHRDIKPPNIMLTPEGVIKLMDFGIAKVSVDHRLTQTGKTVGSLFYMSPEQIRGADVDGRADLYSFGITLYEMVTGRRPFEGESDYSIMAAHLQQAPQPPIFFDASLPQPLNDVILMSIAKDPGQRFQTADAFRQALEAVGKGLGVGPAAAGQGGTQVFSRPVAPPPAPPATPSRPRTPTVLEQPQSQPQMPAFSPNLPQPPMSPLPPPAPLRQMPSHPGLQSMPSPPQPQFSPPYAQMPQAQMAAQSSGGKRGLYMVLGSLVTIGILAAGAVYIPKLLKTRASGEPTHNAQLNPVEKPLPQQPVQQMPGQPTPVQQTPVQQTPSQPPPVQQAAPAPAHQTPGSQGITAPPQRPSPSQRAAVQRPVNTPVQQAPQTPPPHAPPPIQQTPAPQTPAPAAPPPQPAVNVPAVNPVNAELEELNHRKMLLRARVDAINASMTKLEQDQRRMGLGMSGDLVARQHRMVYFLETSDAAMRRGNIEQARAALNNAERELDKLEEHFGR